MTDLNEKLKLVAQYFDGKVYPVYKTKGNDVFAWTGESVQYLRKKSGLPNANSVLIEHCEFHTSYDWQIPVWQKVCNEFLDMENKCTDDIKIYMIQKEKYCKHICYSTPLEAFEILVTAIQFINKMEK